MKTKICFFILIAAIFAIPDAQAQNATQRELIRIQSEISALQKQFLEFEESYSERFDGLRSLVIQLNDEIARSNSTLTRISAALNNRTEDARSQETSLLSEIRELSQKINDLSTGYSILAQQFNDYRVQSTMRAGAASSLSAETMFNQAFRDYTQGDFDMAIDGFTAYVETYPSGETAARALLYIGESYSSPSQNKLRDAIEAFTRLINGYPQTAVVPSALYKRARIATALQQQEDAIADFRDILERFPNAPEADMARVELQLLESAPKPKATTPKATTPPAKKPAGR